MLHVTLGRLPHLIYTCQYEKGQEYCYSDTNTAHIITSSGILLDKGKITAFKLTLNLFHSKTTLCYIIKQNNVAQLLWEYKLIVWDELTTAHKSGTEVLDRTLQKRSGVVD